MFDLDFVDTLNEGGGEGGLFSGGVSQVIQVCFMKSVLSHIRPKSVIEIGTHRGNFCYVRLGSRI